MRRAYLKTSYSYVDSEGFRRFDGEHTYGYYPDYEGMDEAMRNRGEGLCAYQHLVNQKDCKSWRVLRVVQSGSSSEYVVMMDSFIEGDAEVMRSLMIWSKNPTALNELILEAVFEDAGIDERRFDYFKERAMNASNLRLNNG